MTKLIFPLVPLVVVAVIGCDSSDGWRCVTRGQTMFSLSEDGRLGSAREGCSCAEIRAFERKTFGEVDEEALANNFGC